MEPGVTIELSGGLGNQMFQYAAAAGLARKHKVPVYATLADNPRPYYLDKLACRKEIKLCRPSLLGRLTNRPGLFDLQAKQYNQPGFHYDPSFEQLKPPIYLRGYFQSWRYLTYLQWQKREQLEADFAPVSPPSVETLEYLRRIKAAHFPVIVQVRLGDYELPEKRAYHGILSVEYYVHALWLIKRLWDFRPDVFLVSDEPERANAHWGVDPLNQCSVPVQLKSLCNSWTVIDKVPDFEQLTLLMPVAKAYVIANSSFGWWGAWLNPRSDKTVIAPRQWFSPETLRKNNTCDLYPPGWITL